MTPAASAARQRQQHRQVDQRQLVVAVALVADRVALPQLQVLAVGGFGDALRSGLERADEVGFRPDPGLDPPRAIDPQPSYPKQLLIIGRRQIDGAAVIATAAFVTSFTPGLLAFAREH